MARIAIIAGPLLPEQTRSEAKTSTLAAKLAISPGHPEQNRAISLREAASLQSFPDEYEFFGTLTKNAVQIGNAVPVLLAEKLGRHILKLSDTVG